MKSTIVTFSGAIGSGKSSVSRAVAENLGWPCASFGDYVRKVASQRGLGQTRETLQTVGTSLIESGLEEFCRSVLSQVEWSIGQSLIVDGVRHVEALQTLRRITVPSQVLLVHVQMNPSQRKARLQQMEVPSSRLDEWEAHSTEVQVAMTLPELADLTIDGARPLKDLIHEVKEWVRGVVVTTPTQTR